MSTTIAKYYTDELDNWNDSIVYNNSEMDEIEQKLIEVIRRNSIVGIAAKVEALQALLDRISDKFDKLEAEIKKQEVIFKTNSSFIEDNLISTETEKSQNDLRRKMQAIEKEYIDVKFECYNFLSATLKK